MKDFFYVISEIVRFMKSINLQIDEFSFTMWDLWLAVFWIGAAIGVWIKWRDNA